MAKVEETNGAGAGRGSRRAAGRSTPAPGEAALLQSAREVFGRRGYRGARTKEIADHAGVSESLVFRHFGSKAELFERAVVGPLQNFIEDFFKRWREAHSRQWSFERTVGEFVEGLYDLMYEHRALMRAGAAMHLFDDTGGGESLVDSLFSDERVLQGLVEIARTEVDERQLDPVDPMLITRVSIGVVTSMALLDEWLFDPPSRTLFTREQLIHEMTIMVSRGVRFRTVPPGLE